MKFHNNSSIDPNKFMLILIVIFSVNKMTISISMNLVRHNQTESISQATSKVWRATLRIRTCAATAQRCLVLCYGRERPRVTTGSRHCHRQTQQTLPLVSII